MAIRQHYKWTSMDCPKTLIATPPLPNYTRTDQEEIAEDEYLAQIGHVPIQAASQREESGMAILSLKCVVVNVNNY